MGIHDDPEGFLRDAEQKVEGIEASVESLSNQIGALSRKSRAAAHLLGEITATFQIERNRELISQSEFGRELLKIADSWIRRYKRIVDDS